MMWLVIHLTFLVGLRNWISVFIQWISPPYFTLQARGRPHRDRLGAEAGKAGE